MHVTDYSHKCLLPMSYIDMSEILADITYYYCNGLQTNTDSNDGR